jgi:hypothetical protein
LPLLLFQLGCACPAIRATWTVSWLVRSGLLVQFQPRLPPLLLLLP